MASAFGIPLAGMGAGGIMGRLISKNPRVVAMGGLIGLFAGLASSPRVGPPVAKQFLTTLCGTEYGKYN
jgi:hypothetical protein